MSQFQELWKERARIKSYFDMRAMNTGKRWTKARGNAIEMMTQWHLAKALGSELSVIRGGYCEDCENEIDILVVRRNAKRKRFTGVYPSESIIAAIEVKNSFTFFHSYKAVRDALKDIPLLYLAYWHQEKTAKAIKDDFDENNVFIVMLSKDKKPNPEEWNGLVRRIKDLSRKAR